MIKDIASIEIVDLRLRCNKNDLIWTISYSPNYLNHIVWSIVINELWESLIRVSYENVVVLVIETKFDFITDSTDVICVKPIMNSKKSTSWIDEMNLDYLIEKDHKRIWKLSPNYGNKFTAGSVYYFLVNTEFDIDTEDINDCKDQRSAYRLSTLIIWYGHMIWPILFWVTEDPC